MKRFGVLLGLICASSLSTMADVTIDWSADWLSDDAEVGSELQDGWLVGLYLDQDGDNVAGWYNELKLDIDGNVISASGSTSDDLFLNVTRNLVDAGGDITLNPLSNAATLSDNSKVYSIIFNAADISSATKIAVTGYTGNPASPFDIGTPQAVNTTYSIGNEIQSDFYAIPEPAVAGLIGIFGTGLIVARRLFSKEA